MLRYQEGGQLLQGAFTLMAKPLRIASSTIAIVGWAIKTTGTIIALISPYLDARAEISYLQNDVADTQIIQPPQLISSLILLQ